MHGLEAGPMKFSQIIEFETSRVDEFNAHLDAWMAKSEGLAFHTGRC